MTSKTRLKVLFLCTGNSCRSQMAEAWARNLKANLIEPYSAGTAPKGIDPRAVRAMAEVGIEISEYRSKSLSDLPDIEFDYVITLCDDAQQACPFFPAKTALIHHGFDDPPRLAEGARDEDEVMQSYRRVRDEIKTYVETLPESLSAQAEQKAWRPVRGNDMRKEQPAGVDGPELNAQKTHWEKTFAEKVDMFGTEPSYPARKAAALFKKEGAARILELGGGQGRDTLFFALEGFQVYVLDYSREGVETIAKKASILGLSSVVARQHDVRQPLPFPDDFFDGCFSHMLYCMALTTPDLVFLSSEIRRVLKLGRLNIYTVRNTTDAHYRTGVHRGEGLWEVGGFIVHFFSRQKVEDLARGYEIVTVGEFEEGDLPRKLYLVTLRKC